MFKQFVNWLNQEQSSERVQNEHSLELATAVLLFEIMRADEEITDDEVAKYKATLLAHFTLTDSEVDDLLKQSESESKLAVDFFQYTNVINQHCQQAQKVTILESLWRIAYADGTIDAHEEHLIRRMADLLHIPHSSFIKTKHKAG